MKKLLGSKKGDTNKHIQDIINQRFLICWISIKVRVSVLFLMFIFIVNPSICFNSMDLIRDSVNELFLTKMTTILNNVNLFKKKK